jgi:hypothetical protein
MRSPPISDYCWAPRRRGWQGGQRLDTQSFIVVSRKMMIKVRIFDAKIESLFRLLLGVLFDLISLAAAFELQQKQMWNAAERTK